jgi:DHA1 family multidrug resistance protein-like MFS transporter
MSLEKTKRKNLRALSITRFLHGLGGNMFNIVYQPFILELTNSIFITGVLISIGSLMQFFPMPLVGKISDKIGRKITILIGTPLQIFGVLSLIVTDNNTLFFTVIGIIFYFLGFTFYQLNSQFLVSENSKKSKGFAFGLIFFSYFAGSIAGSYLIVVGQGIATRFYLMLFIIFLLIEGFIYLIFISTKNHHIQRKKDSAWIKFLKTKELRIILIFFTMDIFVYSITLSIYNGGLSDYYRLTKEDIALISLWFNVANMAFQIPAGHLTDKIGNKKTILSSQIFGFSFFILNIMAVIIWRNANKSTLIFVLIIAEILFAVSVTTFIPAEQIILTDLGETNKAESYGVIAFARGIGFVPTGTIGGLLVENVNYISPFIFSSIGVVFETVFLLRFFHEKKFSLNTNLEIE